MTLNPDFRDKVIGLLLAFGPVQARAMFGGYGVYLDGLMFGLIAEDVLYFKVDDGNRQEYIDAGSLPFTYEGKSRPVEMSYYRVPDTLMDDPGGIAGWAERAHQAAQRSRIGQPPRRSRRVPNKRPRRR